MAEELVTKAVAEIQPGTDDASTPNGSFQVILSHPSTDRDGEDVKTAEWEQPLPDHITFDIDHGMSVEKTVGSGKPYLADDGTLRVDGTYSSRSLAQETRSLVNEGHIKTVSVAFLRKHDKKAGTTSRELLNGAFVAVPANKNALILASKALDVEEKAGARNSKTDMETIQQIHGLLLSLGASCDSGGDLDTEDTKTVSTTDVSADDSSAATDDATTEAAAKATADVAAEAAAAQAGARIRIRRHLTRIT